jgi:hypothetical protein
MVRSFFKLAVVVVLIIGLAVPSLAKNKFEKELEKETDAVKLTREVQRGGYDVLTTAELKKWIDNRKQMIIVYATTSEVTTAPPGQSNSETRMSSGIRETFLHGKAPGIP